MKLLAAMLLSLTTTYLLACDEHGKTGFIEKNDLWIGVDEKANGGITERQFNRVISRVSSLYRGPIRDLGFNLKVFRKWKNGEVNAFALPVAEKRELEVHMFGGLARHHETTEDSFAIVVCHEIGHFLAGSPRKQAEGSRWASNEGQSDYWGTMKCLRKYFQRENNNIQRVRRLRIPKIVFHQCRQAWGENRKDVAICVRSALAGKALGNMFRALRKIKKPLRFSTPIKVRAEQTFDGHPDPQCRLDTYYSAALCTVPAYVNVSNSNPDIGTCARNKGARYGTRPLCWYKPIMRL